LLFKIWCCKVGAIEFGIMKGHGQMASFCEQCNAEVGFFSKKKVTLSNDRKIILCKSCAAKMKADDGGPTDQGSAGTATVSPLLAGPHLIIRERENDPVSFALQGNELTLGRVPQNDIILKGENVDRRHARLVYQNGKYILVDLRSNGGTLLNGKKVTSPAPVKHKDTFQIGDFVLTLWLKS